MDSKPSSRTLIQTALLGAAVFLIPLLLGLLFVQLHQKLTARRTPVPDSLASLTNRLADASITDLETLLALRRDARKEGLNTEELALRIWAAHAKQPTALFKVAPPETGKHWNWHLSQEGCHAVAVSVETDALDRHHVGLYDLVADEWVWKNVLPWPDAHETPHVFDRHLVLRYVKNAGRFALEVSPDGQILSLEKLGKGAFAIPSRPSPDSLFPGTPVAVSKGVFFVTDTERQSLVGYALGLLPGLAFAGKGDSNTLFSGNGRLKLTIRDGRVTVSDSLTQTVLQQFGVWHPATNIAVTGALITNDGSALNVFLKAEFGGLPSVSREWSVAIATYTGTVVPSFNADALLAKPHRSTQTQTLSRDSRWHLSLAASNVLVVAAHPDMREIARVSLSPLLGSGRPVDHVAFLEEGRHVVIRQADNFWLLDFGAARGYADLLGRITASSEAAAAPAAPPGPAAPATPTAVTSTLGDDPYAEEEPWPELPSPAPFALRAERLADHQAWGYAAALLERCAEYSAVDGRAPRVNPLLFARTLVLSGQKQKARAVCRDALLELIADPSGYNRMVRYHLQGLLFALP